MIYAFTASASTGLLDLFKLPLERGNKPRRSLIDGIDLIILFQALKAMFHLCTNLKLPFHFNCNLILYISQVLPLGDITMIGAVRVSPKNMAHLVQSKFRGKKWKWKFFT